MANEFIADEEYIYINTLYAEAYIPDSLFEEDGSESAIATSYGDGFEIMGLCTMRFFDTPDYDREKTPLDTLNCPIMIETYPSSSSVMMLTINGVEDKYRVFHYEKGDIFTRKHIAKSYKVCEKFINMLVAGKIPNTYDYEMVNTIWSSNFDLMGVDPGVPDLVKQMIISKLYRNKNNPMEEFAMVAGTPGVKPTDYITMHPQQIVANSSVIAALGYENFAEQLCSSIIMSKKNRKQQRSPVEDVILN